MRCRWPISTPPATGCCTLSSTSPRISSTPTPRAVPPSPPPTAERSTSPPPIRSPRPSPELRHEPPGSRHLQRVLLVRGVGPRRLHLPRQRPATPLRDALG